MMSNEVSFCNSILKAVNVLKKLPSRDIRFINGQFATVRETSRGKKSKLEKKLGNPGGNRPGL